MAVSIYVVEDHPFMRRVLVDSLEDIADFQVAGAVESAEEALDELGNAAVDVVLVDARLPGMDGIELVGELTGRWPDLRCLMLSAHDVDSYAEQAMTAGARGYVVKGNPEEVPEAIRRVLEGDVYFSEAVHGGRAPEQ